MCVDGENVVGFLEYEFFTEVMLESANRCILKHRIIFVEQRRRIEKLIEKRVIVVNRYMMIMIRFWIPSFTLEDSVYGIMIIHGH